MKIKIPCLLCEKNVPVNSTKDVLCAMNNVDYGLCESCSPKLQEYLSNRIKPAIDQMLKKQKDHG